MSGSAAVIGPHPRVGRHEARLLRAHLERLRSWDSAAQVRVLLRGSALGVFSAPPLGVLSFIALPVLSGGTTPIDACVRADALLEAILESPGGNSTIVLPAGGPGTPELAVLPPEEGWQLPISGVAGDLTPAVEEAVAEFRARAPMVPSTEALASEIWGRTSFGGLPLRALHAARLLGFLTSDSSRVTAATCTGWKRFSTVRGQVFVRDPRALGRQHLSVVR